MRFNFALVLLYVVLLALSKEAIAAKGSSGGGGKGGSTGGKGGGTSSGGKNTGSGGSTGGKPSGIPRTSPGSTIGSGYKTKGYTPGAATNRGVFNPSNRGVGSGFFGNGLGHNRLFWIALFGPLAFHHCGYHCRYGQRYNENEGKYYVRQYDPLVNNNTKTVIYSTARNTDDGADNRMQFVFSTASYPSIRATYYDSSNVQAASGEGDFTYGLTLFRVLEYVDGDGNGVFSQADNVTRSVDLNQGQWGPLSFIEKFSDTRRYYEATSEMVAPVANSTQNVTFAVTFRATNILINSTDTLVLPNAGMIDFNIKGLTPQTNVALQVLLRSSEQFKSDPNPTLKDGNLTKGIGFGDAAGGRFEWFTTSATGSPLTSDNITNPTAGTTSEDTRIVGGKNETVQMQTLNLVSGSGSVNVRAISFLDEEILTPEFSSARRAISKTWVGGLVVFTAMWMLLL
ncbi:uncharacterized protein SPPG_01744 [Spizellomyces punctatus DAOM BR117]|uniref:Uncharacterized protein n=1 Tax=Spizellomyces punctatus (strain DAOM BR117) TaxID=645134 RepID=A0A0L0HNN6_SPIPD|nr:uncharacterized protein SPPG_01744 [Spizellomyces punctatus DAOM BR117]KND02658.1 hypothetical protein SPPG_01744 [Spizellomyces punctatus DAOM BR117]|eukprot:XP_016610697.1 hypothetical protein SPPG_01744 [Spizellomyces punctatus DAOM BR117]